MHYASRVLILIAVLLIRSTVLPKTQLTSYFTTAIMPGVVIDRYDHVPVTKEDCKYCQMSIGVAAFIS